MAAVATERWGFERGNNCQTPGGFTVILPLPVARRTEGDGGFAPAGAEEFIGGFGGHLSVDS